MEANMPVLARLQQLYPQLLSRIPVGCPDGHMLAALQRSAVRFFRESQSWRQNLPTVDGVALQKSYTVTNPWQAEIMRVLRVGVRNATEISDDPDANGMALDPNGYEFIPQTSKLKFTFAPFSIAVTDGMLIKALLVPTAFSSELPEWLMSRYHEGIVYGAAHDICSQPGSDRYNLEVAQSANNTFKSLVATAFNDAETDYSSKPFQFGRRYDCL
jgi:hypothetical protein